MNNDPRTQWIQEYSDGLASAETTAKLERALQEDPEFRVLFLEYLNVDGALASRVASGQRPEAGVASTRGDVRSRRTPWLAMAAGMTLAGLAAWVLHTAGRPFATVASSAGSVLSQGTSLRGAALRFDVGAVEFLTAKGARVVVEAPAEVRFESADRLRVLRGKVAAEVPPEARGFTVLTPNGSAVDLGTRFGVDVPAAGAAEVHVFQGEVVAQAKGAPTKQSLHAGDALAMNDGAGISRDLRSAAFIQTDEMPRLAAGLFSGQRARAQATVTVLKKDPALIGLFDFNSWESLPGMVRTVQGRWPGSRVPEFAQSGDHLKVNVGGDREWPQLTLAAWVRIDQLGSPYQSLYHTDGWNSETPGQVHWMITRSHTMRLALRGNTLAPGSVEKQGFPDSVTSVLPERGRWTHLAVVYNSETLTVRFYLNGEFDKETLQETAHPARLGAAQIGNWNQQDRKLSGRMDEFLLLGRALTDAEVRELFESGNPYR